MPTKLYNRSYCAWEPFRFIHVVLNNRENIKSSTKESWNLSTTTDQKEKRTNRRDNNIRQATTNFSHLFSCIGVSCLLQLLAKKKNLLQQEITMYVVPCYYGCIIVATHSYTNWYKQHTHTPHTHKMNTDSADVNLYQNLYKNFFSFFFFLSPA